jgi:hypothetical protein
LGTITSFSVLRYERLASDAKKEFGKAVKRLEFTPDAEHLKSRVENHQLEKLKQKVMNLNYEVETTHFRQGGRGNFLREMPPHTLQDVNNRFGDYLARWGYPLSTGGKEVDAYGASLRELK